MFLKELPRELPQKILLKESFGEIYLVEIPFKKKDIHTKRKRIGEIFGGISLGINLELILDGISQGIICVGLALEQSREKTIIIPCFG